MLFYETQKHHRQRSVLLAVWAAREVAAWFTAAAAAAAAATAATATLRCALVAAAAAAAAAVCGRSSFVSVLHDDIIPPCLRQTRLNQLVCSGTACCLPCISVVVLKNVLHFVF